MSGRRGTTTLEVEIFGATYNVRGDNDPDHLQELADHVDRKMREIAQHLSQADTTKIAILAALNIADELFEVRKGLRGERNEITEKVAGLAGELEQALKSKEESQQEPGTHH